MDFRDLCGCGARWKTQIRETRSDSLHWPTHNLRRSREGGSDRDDRVVKSGKRGKYLVLKHLSGMQNTKHQFVYYGKENLQITSYLKYYKKSYTTFRSLKLQSFQLNDLSSCVLPK
jgi:hypothetical protein